MFLYVLILLYYSCFIILILSSIFFFLMIRRPPRSTRTEHSFPTRRSSDLASSHFSSPGAAARPSTGVRSSSQSSKVRQPAQSLPRYTTPKEKNDGGKIGRAHV